MLQNYVREFFLGIDKVVYSVASVLFNLIVNLANFDLFSNEVINKFSNRIYLILGIVMVFKLMISFFQILVDPDSMNDKEKGLSGILKRVVVSMILIVLVPSIFDLAKQLQERIVPIIPKVVLASKVDSEEEAIVSAGERMSYYTFLAFFYYADEANCNYGTLLGTPGADSSTAQITSVNSITKAQIKEKKCSTTTDGYTYRYQYLMSTAVGIYLIYVLLSVAIDVAKRTIKLGICQIIAPIPIASYIDPKLSKQSFDNWVQTTIKVYLSLFTSLIAVYFVIYVFQLLFNGGETSIFSQAIGKYGTANGLLVILFIIIGLLMFIKEMPKFISGMLGIKDGFSDIGAMFKRAGAFASTSGAVATAGTANFLARRNEGLPTAIRSSIGGAGSAFLRGNRAALSGKSGKEAFNVAHRGSVTARQNRQLDKLNGVNVYDRAGVRFHEFMGVDTDVSLAENRQKAYSTFHQDVGNFKKAAMGRYLKTANVAMVEGAKTASTQLGQLLVQNMDAINASGNADLQNYLNRYEWKTDATGKVDLSSVKLKNGVHIGYHDIAAIHTDATQAGIGSVAGLTDENGALTLAAQKDLFTATMAGEVRDTAGNKIAELNVGSGQTHTDIDTAFQQANLHLAENAVPLSDNGETAQELQEWFRGTSPKHPGEDFGKMDDYYQRKSAKVSEEMATSREARARESNRRHDSNKQQNSGK